MLCDLTHSLTVTSSFKDVHQTQTHTQTGPSGQEGWFCLSGPRGWPGSAQAPTLNVRFVWGKPGPGLSYRLGVVNTLLTTLKPDLSQRLKDKREDEERSASSPPPHRVMARGRLK